MDMLSLASQPRIPWNKGKPVGQKAPLRISEIWAIRVRLEIYGRLRDLALFNLAIDSKLRAATLFGCASSMSAMALMSPVEQA